MRRAEYDDVSRNLTKARRRRGAVLLLGSLQFFSNQDGAFALLGIT